MKGQTTPSQSVVGEGTEQGSESEEIFLTEVSVTRIPITGDVRGVGNCDAKGVGSGSIV